MQPWQFLPVHPLLKQVIDSMIIMKVDDFSSLPISSQFHYPWTAQASLFFTISEEIVSVKNAGTSNFDIYPANFIIGPSLMQKTVQSPNCHHVLGITFSSCGLHRLCKLPISEALNDAIDASILLGKEINELSQKIKEVAGNNQLILTLVNQFFIKKLENLAPLTAFDRAIEVLVKADGNYSIDGIAKLACLGSRQLERLSMDRLGMSPKLFARLTRFSKAYMLKEAFPNLNWSAIAYQCGYYDQMHLIRDFKIFSGYTPTAIEEQLQNSITAVTALQRNLIY